MFTAIVTILTVCLFLWFVKLTVKLAWGAAKIIAVLLAVLALPLLLIGLIFFSGIFLLLPLLLLACAIGLVKLFL